jgi:serine/threonine-protein kinase HipA
LKAYVTLEVRLHGQRVGALTEDPSGVQFRFDDDYHSRPDRPVLGQWFEDAAPGEAHFGGPGRLPPFFANLEPEGALRRWLARKHQFGSDISGLLGVCGMDLPGAIQIVPEVDKVSRARFAVTGRVFGVGQFSLAGVQIKLPMSIEKDNRITIPNPGGTSGTILKIPPPDRFTGLAENEHAVMTWARCAGFSVPETYLVDPPPNLDFESELGGAPPRRSLLIRRFDRDLNGLVHQEDFCQILGLDPDQRFPPDSGDRHRFGAASEFTQRQAATVEGLGLVVARLLGPGGAVEFLRRCVFMVAAGNGDAHLKNWSVIYPDRRNAAWSPLYDQVSTIAWHSEIMVLPLFGIYNFSAVHLDSMIRLGVEMGLSRSTAQAEIDGSLESIARAWPIAQDVAPFPKHHAMRLVHHWGKATPLLRNSKLKLKN